MDRNVDRLYALYQAAHPNLIFEAQNIGNNGNVFLADGETVDADTPLLPFRKPDGGGAFWTANEVAKTETFGYAYPETLKNITKLNDEAETEEYEEEDEGNDEDNWFTRSVTTSIVQLYSSSARAMLTTSHATGGTSTSSSSLLAADGTFTDWCISTSALTHLLPLTFVVRFSFVGDFSSDKPVDVGSWVNAMPSSHEASRKRAAVVEQMYNSSVSLTSALLDQVREGKLRSLGDGDVVPYLKRALSWNVVAVSTSCLMVGFRLIMIGRWEHDSAERVGRVDI